MMAGKARVHELAKEFGLSSKQVLRKLQDMGEYVNSPSSTVESSVVRRLRDALAGHGQILPRQREWRPAGKNPYSPRASAPVGDVPRPPRIPRKASAPVPPPPPNSGRSDDDSFMADFRRAQAESNPPTRSVKRRQPTMTPLAKYIAENTGFGGSSYVPRNRESAMNWALQWYALPFFDDYAIAWLRAGLNVNESAVAQQMHDAGWRPETLRRIVRDETVLALWRKNVFPIAAIDGMLRGEATA